MQKCIKNQIYTPLENLLETLEKNFAAKRLKKEVFENRVWPPTPYLDPPGGPTVPTYVSPVMAVELLRIYDLIFPSQTRTWQISILFYDKSI